jgi:branched-subunit amino acid aminotransferase/4-amino-4-deoxychorismate lyase
MTTVPYDQREGFIWLNGKLVPWAEARLHVLSHALHYASAVFEGMRAYDGEIFKLTEHNQRLHESAKILDFAIPYPVAELDKAAREVLRANQLTDAYIRPIAWRGSEQMGVAAQKTKINVAICAWDWGSYFDPRAREKGLKLAFAKYRRPDPATAPVKSKAAGLYMICTIEKHRAERDGYADALMLDWRGQIAECTGANIFFVQNGVLHTPTARLLPRRHHPPRGDRPRQAARPESGRASDPAAGARRFLRVLHHRHRRRGHAGLIDRRLHIRRRPHHQDPDGRLRRAHPPRQDPRRRRGVGARLTRGTF